MPAPGNCLLRVGPTPNSQFRSVLSRSRSSRSRMRGPTSAFRITPVRGTSTRCWLPKGHGTLGFQQALTSSCNSYFLQLAKETSPSAMRKITQEYGLPAPPGLASPAELIGLDPGWQVAPLELGSAYVRLATQSKCGHPGWNATSRARLERRPRSRPRMLSPKPAQRIASAIVWPAVTAWWSR